MSIFKFHDSAFSDLQANYPDRCRREKRNGTGDVLLGSGAEGEGQVQSGFLDIREPKKVEQILKKLTEHASES